MFDDPQYASNNFYDVKSVKYLESLRVNMEDATWRATTKAPRNMPRRLLDADT